MLKKVISILVVLTACSCARLSDRAIIAEYHGSVIEYSEGRRSAIDPYTIEVERAMDALVLKGELWHTNAVFPDIEHSRHVVTQASSIVHGHYRDVVDATFKVPTNPAPLAVSIYYYPNYHDEIEQLLNKIREIGQQGASTVPAKAGP